MICSGRIRSAVPAIVPEGRAPSPALTSSALSPEEEGVGALAERHLDLDASVPLAEAMLLEELARFDALRIDIRRLVLVDPKDEHAAGAKLRRACCERAIDSVRCV